MYIDVAYFNEFINNKKLIFLKCRFSIFYCSNFKFNVEKMSILENLYCLLFIFSFLENNIF